MADAESERDLYAQVTRVSDLGADKFLAGMNARQEAVDRIARELGEAKARLPVTPAMGDVGKLWGDWTTDQRRLVLGGALGGVVVQRG